MMTPHTFLYRTSRSGRICEALHYVCGHGEIMSQCEQHQYGAEVERAMLDWWNGSFSQMQDRIVVRDQILRGDNVS